MNLEELHDSVAAKVILSKISEMPLNKGKIVRQKLTSFYVDFGTMLNKLLVHDQNTAAYLGNLVHKEFISRIHDMNVPNELHTFMRSVLNRSWRKFYTRVKDHK